MPPTGNVVIVDDYGPTRRMAPAFREAGYGCVRVQSTIDIPRVYRSAHDPDDYVAHIVHEGSLPDTLRAVAKYEPAAVVTGSELGVELSDALSEHLGLATNGTALSTARRDKYTMIETVRAAGIPVARQLRITSESGLRRWHQEIAGRIVVKPARSAAGDGVSFCDSPDEAVLAYRKVCDEVNIFSERNESAVAQEYLIGTEYIVNTVSGAGHHHVCDIWRTVRIGVNGVTDALAGIYIVPREGEVQDQLATYAGRVLDAVGIRYGPAHIEIKVTPDGLRLVEIGARMGGSDNPYYAELATGESQIGWTVDAYVNPARFDRRYRQNYSIREYVGSSVMLAPCRGTLRSYPFLSAVEALESLLEIRMAIKPGEPIAPSRGGVRHPMIVNFKHPAEEVVMRDMETLRYLDGHAFYEVD